MVTDIITKEKKNILFRTVGGKYLVLMLQMLDLCLIPLTF
jgi:hypothetical protein